MCAAPSPTIIWIRHAAKEYSNSKGPVGKTLHDPDILPESELQIKALGQSLLQYGPPDLCLVSPYLRARRTAKILLSQLPELLSESRSRAEPLSVKILPEIGEFLGWQRGKLSVEPETASFGPLPPLGEKLFELDIRASHHLEDALSSGAKVIWVVSHGILMKSVYQLLSRSKPVSGEWPGGKPDYLATLILTPEGVKLG